MPTRPCPRRSKKRRSPWRAGQFISELSARSTMKKYIFTLALTLALLCGIPAMAASPVLLELFTSQGCSSCPPADRLLEMLAADKTLLPLSFHIDYWNSPAWTDPYALPASTARQRDYARALGLNNVFTPQLIVNGTASLVGSDQSGVRTAIEIARRETPLTIGMMPSDKGIALGLPDALPAGANLWEVRFNNHAETKIGGGENGGRILRSVNNVTGVKLLDPRGGGSLTLDRLADQDDGVAVLAQMPNQSRVLGFGVYQKGF